MNANKEIMAANIKLYMEKNQVNATEICKALGIKHNTFSDWVNAKTYPRIDKIELLAKYFGINKANLVESHPLSFDSPEAYEAAWWEKTGSSHPIELSKLEYGLVLEYRAADDVDKRSIERILRLEKYAKLLKNYNDKKQKDNKNSNNDV